MSASGKQETLKGKQEVLRKRARLLAQKPVSPIREEAAPRDVVVFETAGESYAVESAMVREVFPLGSYTPVPCTPDWLLGIVNIRGRIVSVIDLRAIFALGNAAYPADSKAVVLAAADMEFAMAAELVSGVRTIPSSLIQAPLPTLTGVRKEYTKGVTAEGLVLLDAAAMLADPRLVVSETVATET